MSKTHSCLHTASDNPELTSQSLFEGRVIVVLNKSTEGSESRLATEERFLLPSLINSLEANMSVVEVLVQMHGGLWTVCLDLSGKRKLHYPICLSLELSEKCKMVYCTCIF